MPTRVRLAACLASCFAAACATSTPPTARVESLAPSDLYPLRAGNAWSYDVDTGDPSTTLAITRVESFDGRVAEVRTGRSLLRYEVADDGIRLLPGDAWLLRAPLTPGSEWLGPGGRRAKLVAVDTSVQTRAGSFERCVEVSETGGQLEVEVRTVYCPGVGPVSVDSTMRSRTSDRVVTVSARLRGFDVGATSGR